MAVVVDKSSIRLINL